MLVFFRCVAEAVMENGVKGLASLVPGGEFACKVAAAAYKKYSDRKKDADQKKEMEALAQLAFDNARAMSDGAQTLDFAALGALLTRLKALAPAFGRTM
jgi:hypothetical protein